MARWFQLAVFVAAWCLESNAAADQLKQVVSREDPLFEVATSRLVAGRDGDVYLSGNRYLLRTKPDGSDKHGSEVTYAVNRVAANAAGIMATANGHFVHSVKFWTTDFKSIGNVSDFLVNDAVEWWAPYDVEAGASGDFYAIDQNRNRIVRVASPGRTVATYALDRLGETLTRKMPELRVWEPGKQFYLLGSDTLRVVGFDGSPRWILPTRVSARVAARTGGFDVDDNGNAFLLEETEKTVKVYDSSGHEAETIRLQMGEPATHVSDLRVMAGKLLVKTTSPSELFEVYDRKTGALKRVVHADNDELDVSVPDGPWTAGVPVPVKIDLVTARRLQSPQWKAWMRPLGVPEFQEVSLHDGSLTPPPDASGLYQLRVSAGLEGARGEYWVDEVVEVRVPHSKGSISIFTPFNRIYFGAGESVPVSIVARATERAELPHRILMRLTRGGQAIAESDVELPATDSTEIVLRPEMTRALGPGRYLLTAEAPGFTVAGQPLEIGPGISEPPIFSLVQHGDYVRSQPVGTLFDTPERVAARLEKARRLGLNMFVDRIDASFVNETSTAVDLAARLKGDPSAVAFDKATIGAAGLETVAGYGAYGIEQRAILLKMDAGLPLGSGYDARTPKQLADVVTRVTSGFSAYPAFRGWSWAANWWVPTGAAATVGPDEKVAYIAARKKAESTGAWDPILDSVSERTLSHAVDAERQLRAALQGVAPGKLSVMTGPYRAPGVLPPVTFQNADEVDLHYQAEQIQPPIVTGNNVDFYKRPGKRAWGHPELWNDDGTGGMILPTLFQMVMRGADGVGWSGEPPWWGPTPSDPRATGAGITSILRGVDRLFRDYGPWLTSLHGSDRVAIVVSSRMMGIDQWAGTFGGEYFGQLYEAYGATLYAHRPATFVFTDDLTPETLKGFRAILVVAQRVQFEPKLLDSLTSARAAGVTIVYDGTCRPELVASFTPLGIAFDHIAGDPSVWQDDSAHLRIPAYFEKDAETLDRILAPTVLPVAGVGEPAVLLTERAAGQGRFVWAVDNVEPDLDPALAWRTSLIMSQRMPLVVPVRLKTGRDDVVYDVFGLREIQPIGGAIDADLRSLPARLFAILPRRIGAIELSAPRNVVYGEDHAWTVAVLDERGRPIDSNVPVKVELRAADGSVLREETLTTHATEPATGRWTMPIDPPPGPFSIRAEELFSGKTATIPIAIAAPARMQDLLGVPSHSMHWDAGQRLSTTGHEPGGSVPVDRGFGPHLKDIAVSTDGDLALVNAMNWDENLYAVDLHTGQVRWRQRIGNHFSYAPQANAKGFAVEGFDRTTAEGYHLFLLDAKGRPERRFALYGLPKRATNWAFGSLLSDSVDSFSTSPDGDWVASAGELGLVVWDREGHRRWSLDWSQKARRRMALIALNRDTLMTLEGAIAVAYDARDGRSKWTSSLAGSGNLLGGVVASDGETIAIRADGQGGRIYVVKNGHLLNTIPSPADQVALSSDGRWLAATSGHELNWYEAAGGLVWSFTGDDTLRRPRISTDGQRIVVGSELGTLYVLSASGRVLWTRDCGALPVANWLAGGDLLIATWMGDVQRLNGRYTEVWSTHIEPAIRDIRPELLSADHTPTTRVESWGNAAKSGAPLVPNLLTETRARVTSLLNETPQTWQNPIEGLMDGKPEAPTMPWLGWSAIELIDSGWWGHLTLAVDTSPSKIHVTGVTFVEDPAHPESWLRDVRLQYWDEHLKEWHDGPYLLSNVATHTHWLETPIESARFRFVTTGGGAWPAGNLRLGELVFHGTVLPLKTLAR